MQFEVFLLKHHHHYLSSFLPQHHTDHWSCILAVDQFRGWCMNVSSYSTWAHICLLTHEENYGMTQRFVSLRKAWVGLSCFIFKHLSDLPILSDILVVKIQPNISLRIGHKCCFRIMYFGSSDLGVGGSICRF